MLSINLTPGMIVDGRYKVIECVGDGGMGRVFKARELGLERVVALKVLHSTLIGDKKNQQRFTREGKVLSQLHHPNILTLYRIGIWKEALPYIAMEFLEGQSLRAVMKQGTRLSVERVIAIGLQVCSAMEHAHSRSILHRDLKPDNIMLVEFPSSDSVKIVDFGLAKLLPDARQQASQHLTQTGDLVGSIYYMSPEQCLGKKADARSDIYSLGCLLYEAMAGEPPLVADNPIILMRLHSEVMPEPLANKLGQTFVVGMDTVLMRAMAKDPAVRYQSMAEMHADLKLVLDGKGQEIVASPTPMLSRRIALPVVWLLPLLFLLPISVVLVQRQQHSSETMELRSGKHTGMEPNSKGAVDDKLESKYRKLARVAATYGPDHLEVAKAISELAKYLSTQKRFAEAELLLERGLRIREKALGTEHTAVAYDLYWLGDLKIQQGKFAQAEPLLKRSLQIREKALGPEDPDVGGSSLKLGEVYKMQRRYAEAEPLLKRGLQLLEKALGPAHANVAAALSQLGEFYRAQGRYAEAEPLLKQCLQIRENAQVQMDLESLLGLADCYKHLGKTAEADTLGQRARAIKVKQPGKS